MCIQALNEMKTRKTPRTSDISLELIAASGGVGIEVMAEICQNVLDGLGMPVQWVLNIVVPIIKWNGDTRNCSCYTPVKLLVHGMGVVERLLEKRFHRIVFVDEIQFDAMPEGGAIEAVFVMKKMQEEYHAKVKKSYMCFMDLENAFDRVPRNYQ